MELTNIKKVKDGKYLKNYDLTYINKAGKEKKYEIVSRREIHEPADLGKKSSGVSIVVTANDKLLLLREFRMGVNKEIMNLVAGMIEEGETIEDCIRRELFEETGLSVKRIIKILPASYAAVAISDTSTNIAFVEAEGEFSDHTSENEQIKPRFYSRQEVEELLQTESFSSRCQLIAYMFTEYPFPPVR
ncbi:MAG: NUDIX hydrolase [Lachnospiraceae bacterium]|nr:NUDIX hydrolase [Lachnospiraceae bacterium]